MNMPAAATGDTGFTGVLLVLGLLLGGGRAARARVFHAYPPGHGGGGGGGGGGLDFCGCVQAAAHGPPGTECRLHSGRHFVGPAPCPVAKVRGTAARPIVVAAAGDGPVVVDGTVAWTPADDDWTRTPDGLWATPVPASAAGGGILQLFVDGELQVLARHPNARWSDKSVFLAVENWFRSASPGVHDLETGQGLLRDQGKCVNPSDCCSRCNTHDLAASGVNATGALLILNAW